MLLLADRLEQQHPSRDLNIDEVRLPMGRADLRSLNFKRAAFGEPAQNPEAKINILYQTPVQVRQPLLLGIDQDRSSHALESLGLHCRRDKCRVRPKVKPQIGAIPAVVLKQEGARQQNAQGSAAGVHPHRTVS